MTTTSRYKHPPTCVPLQQEGAGPLERRFLWIFFRDNIAGEKETPPCWIRLSNTLARHTGTLGQQRCPAGVDMRIELSVIPSPRTSARVSVRLLRLTAVETGGCSNGSLKNMDIFTRRWVPLF